MRKNIYKKNIQRLHVDASVSDIIVFCAVEEVVRDHLSILFWTNTGFSGTRLIIFRTAQHIKKIMVSKSIQNMSN